jgi:hypothetical protein
MHGPSLVHIDWHPGVRTLRSFGFVALAVFAAVAYATWPGSGQGEGSLASHWKTAISLGAGGLGLASAAFSLLRPTFNRPLYVALSCLSYPASWATAWIGLLVLFFGVITPVALLSRCFGRRSLRHRRSESSSAWWPARPGRDKASYFRQF